MSGKVDDKVVGRSVAIGLGITIRKAIRHEG
jgi:hypothetical protein